MVCVCVDGWLCNLITANQGATRHSHQSDTTLSYPARLGRSRLQGEQGPQASCSPPSTPLHLTVINPAVELESGGEKSEAEEGEAAGRRRGGDARHP